MFQRAFSTSRQWAQRQSSDPFVRLAREHDYRSRAAWKLKQISDRYSLFKGALRPRTVIDLGAAPGSWSQVLQELLSKKGRRIIAVDKTMMEPLEGVTFIQGDFTDSTCQGKIEAALDGCPLDMLLSDMAPNTSGHSSIDHLRSIELVRAAITFSSRLRSDGTFLAKVFQGPQEKEIEGELKVLFEKVHWIKPEASRQESKERFILALNRKATIL